MTGTPRGHGASVAQIAAWLGLTPGYVRRYINDHPDIHPTGQHWKAKLYNGQQVARHLGSHDRRQPPTSPANTRP